MKNLFLPLYLFAVHANEEAQHHFHPSYYLKFLYVRAGGKILSMPGEKSVIRQ